MRQRDSALIINVTSLAALLPVPFMGAYNAPNRHGCPTMSLQIEPEIPTESSIQQRYSN
jgi:hypothetical protein